MYNPKSGEHVLTANENEIETMRNSGWQADGGDRMFWTRRWDNGITDFTR